MLDAAAVAAILAGLGLPAVAAVTEFTGGSSDVYRLELNDGTTLVLKGFAADHVAPHKDAYAAGLVSYLGIPVTRYLLIDESRTRLPFRFALTTYLEGEAATSLSAHPRYTDLFRQIGGLARQLHGVKLQGFGSFPTTGGAAAHATNAEYIRGLADAVFERFLHYGGEPRMTDKLKQIFDRAFDAIVPASRQAVFAHDDLHPGNILVTERDGGLAIAGLIDFGNARANSDVMDLAKTIFCCEHMAPGCTQTIMDGYGPIDHPSPTQALAFYTLLHRVTMWYWLRHVGKLPSADAPSDIIEALQITAASA